MYVIKSMKLAGYLMQRGFVLHELGRANDGSNRNVFLFNDSKQLKDAITVYTTLKKK